MNSINSKWKSRKLFGFIGFEVAMLGLTAVSPHMAGKTIPVMGSVAIAYLGSQGIADAVANYQGKQPAQTT